MGRYRRMCAVLAGVVTVLLPAGVAAGAAPMLSSRLVQVDLSSGGAPGNGYGLEPPAVSATGRYVAFSSAASNLVAGDTNGVTDVFRRDTRTGTTIRVSVSSAGRQGNALSGWPSISADGRYVAFESNASNLVRGDTNGLQDVFVRDTRTNTTTRVSVSSSGAQAVGRADEFGDFNFYPQISADGSRVVFASLARNLVPRRPSYGLYLHLLRSGRTELADTDPAGRQWLPNGLVTLSADNRLLAYTGRPPGTTAAHVVVRNMVTHHFVFNEDKLSSPALSGNGRYLAYCGRTGQLSSLVYLLDLRLRTVELVSPSLRGGRPNDDSCGPSVSYDGSRVTFGSMATDLTRNPDHNQDTDLYLWDRGTHRVILLSQRADGAAADGGSAYPQISANGTAVAFESDTTDLQGSISHDYVGHYYLARVTG